MNRYLKAALGTGGLFFILLLGWLQLSQIYTTEKAPESFEVLSFLEKNSFTELPGLDLEDLDGESIPLRELARDKVVIVSFWASWCEPCAEEFPSMMKLLAEYPGKVLLLAVSNDSQKDDILTFAKAFNLSASPDLKILWDKDQKNAKLFQLNRLPESYVFTKMGTLSRKVVGSRDWANEDAKEYFRQLTEEK